MRLKFILPKIGGRGKRIILPIMMDVFGEIIPPRRVFFKKKTEDYASGYMVFPIPDVTRILIIFDVRVGDGGNRILVPGGIDDAIILALETQFYQEKCDTLKKAYKIIRGHIFLTHLRLKTMNEQERLFIIEERNNSYKYPFALLEDIIMFYGDKKEIEHFQYVNW